MIYIVRDPRSVVKSFANHNQMSLEEATNKILEFTTLTGEKKHSLNMKDQVVTHMGSWSSNYNTWKEFKKLDRYLLIKYEDLISNREETFLKILKFLFKLRNINLIVDQNKLKNVINSTSFENLKKLEQQNGFTEHVKDKQGKKIVFFDKGAKREWVNFLDKDMTAEIEKTFNKEMIELGYL